MNASPTGAAADVAAVVVSYQPDPATLGEVLRAAAAQAGHVIVVDNASDPDPRTRIAATGQVEWLRLADNLGVGTAQNAGIARARSLGARHVLLLDQDSVPAAGMVDELLGVAALQREAGMQVAAVGPQYTDPAGEHLSGFVRFAGLGFARIHCDGAARSVETDFLIASGMLVPLDTLDAVGAMDDSLFIDHVDTEWCLRARARGYRCVGACRARMRHALGERRQRIWLLRWRNVAVHRPFRYFYLFRNSLLLYRRRYLPLRWKLADGLRLVGMAAICAALPGDRGERLAMIARGLRDGWRGTTGRLRED